MRSFTLPMFRIAMAAFWFCARCSENSRFCKSCSQMAAIRVRSSATRKRRPCLASSPRSSSARMRPKASRFCPGAGSSKEPFHGSDAAGGWPRTSKTSIGRRWRFSTSPPFASCSEDSVMKHEVHGPTLSKSTSSRPTSAERKSANEKRRRKFSASRPDKISPLCPPTAYILYNKLRFSPPLGDGVWRT